MDECYVNIALVHPARVSGSGIKFFKGRENIRAGGRRLIHSFGIPAGGRQAWFWEGLNGWQMCVEVGGVKDSQNKPGNDGVKNDYEGTTTPSFSNN
jgi:hypothetical protein